MQRDFHHGLLAMGALDGPRARAGLVSAALVASAGCTTTTPESARAVFTLEEATIADVNAAFDAGALSCQELVQR